MLIGQFPKLNLWVDPRLCVNIRQATLTAKINMDLQFLHFKTLTIVLFSLLLLTVQVNADADPEADPEAKPEAQPLPEPDPEALSFPEAEADPDPEANGRYQWGYPGPNYIPTGGAVSTNNNNYIFGRSPCEMTNKCCGMANSKCCFNEGQQRCYTIWERKCDTEDQPECQLRVDRHCHNVRVRDCRIISEIAYRNFAVSQCYPAPVTKCFEYEKKICSLGIKPEVHTITWINEKLTPLSEEPKSHCFDQKTVNCTTKVVAEKVTEQERKERKLTDTQRRCRMVQKKSPDQEVSVPVARVVYNTMCYNVPRSTCSPNACSMTGYCGRGTNVCSLTEFSSNTICPEPSNSGSVSVDSSSAGRAGCQQVKQPVCTDSGACQAGYQQCCSSNIQRICRQVPQRIEEQVKQVLPGAITWQEECQDYPMDRVEYYYEPVEKVVNRNKDECEQVTQPHCHNYTIPTFGVINETKSDMVTVTLPACQHTIVKDKYCHTFRDGEIACRNTTVKKGFRINKVVCDRMVNKQECFNIPVADCRVGSATNCKMVPRQICQDTCSQSPYCQQCDAFRNGPGFGSCSSTTCGNYYPNDQSLRDSATTWTSGVISTEDVASDSSGYVNGDQSSTDEVFDVGGSSNSEPVGDYFPVSTGERSRSEVSSSNSQGYFPQGGFNPAQAVPDSLTDSNEDLDRPEAVVSHQEDKEDVTS